MGDVSSGEFVEEEEGEEDGEKLVSFSWVSGVMGCFLGDSRWSLGGNGTLGCHCGWVVCLRRGLGAHVTLLGRDGGCIVGEHRAGAC